MTTTERALADGHLRMLQASAISEEVAHARGYWTATKRSELRDLGFATTQQLVTALVIPTWGVDGEIVNYQCRPDTPRIDPDRGREIKYETVAGSSIRLDVPPSCRPWIGEPRRPLWVTEGARKADALATAGVTAIALLGVDCFKTDDWDRVALQDRRVLVAYDSDVMVNPSVHSALDRIQKYLAAKGARVQFVYLPTTVGKIGVDDYLANGGTVADLHALVEDELRPAPVEEKPKRSPALPTARLLNTLAKLFCRFVRFPTEHEPAALALWTLHTYALEAAQATPYLLVVSPEKRSGKTRVLEVADLIVREPVRSSNISAAGVFQAIEKWAPTLLVDEIDSVFRAKSETAEALRGVLNAGNRRGSHVIRGSQEGEPVRFGTFCPKAMAGINTGKLPDTIRDRSIVLAMERRRDDEPVGDLFPSELAEQLDELRTRLEDWAAENTEQLKAWRRPDRTEGLDDRLQEAWDALLAIADHAQAGWPEKSRQAATALAKGAEDAGEAAHGHVVIETLRGLFDANGAPLSSKTICEKLNEDEEAPFGGYSDGAGMKPRALAKLLKPYGIKPKVVRIGLETPRGYEREQFAEVWRRYTPDEHARNSDPPGEAQQAQQAQQPNAHGDWDVADVADVADNQQVLPHAHVASNGTAPLTPDPRVQARPGETYEEWEARVEATFAKEDGRTGDAGA